MNINAKHSNGLQAGGGCNQDCTFYKSKNTYDKGRQTENAREQICSVQHTTVKYLHIPHTPRAPALRPHSMPVVLQKQETTEQDRSLGCLQASRLPQTLMGSVCRKPCLSHPHPLLALSPSYQRSEYRSICKTRCPQRKKIGCVCVCVKKMCLHIIVLKAGYAP